MEKGRLRKEGESVEKASENEIIQDKNDTIIDSLGNEIKIEKKVELSDKEKKKAIKSLQKQLKDGRKKGILTENEMAKLEDELFELQSS